MENKLKEAMDESIENWEGRLSYALAYPTARLFKTEFIYNKDCPLCRETMGKCILCPIVRVSKATHCYGTPYVHVIMALDSYEPTGKNVAPFVQKEVDFLKEVRAKVYG